MEATTSIAGLVETYPSQFTRGIQNIISNKKEFKDLTFKVEDGSKLVPGTMFYANQLATQRYMRFADDLFIMDAPGTGKTLQYLGLAENILDEYDKRRAGKSNDPYVSHIGKVLIFVANKNLEADIKNQLICKASAGRYLVPEVVEATTERAQRQAANKVLKDAGYQIHRYRTFVNMIRKEYPTEDDDERMAEDFADSLFIVDEAHNISNEDADVDSEEDAEGSVYETFWRLFHVARRCKRIIATATPMINDPNELKSLLNLILPANSSMPLDFDYLTLDSIDAQTWFPDIPYRSIQRMTREEASLHFRGQVPQSLDMRYVTIEDLEPYLRGRVTYVRALSTGAVPVAQGERSEEVIIDTDTGDEFISQIVTQNLAMSEHQSRGYFRALAKESSDFYQEVRQASLIIFPDGYVTGRQGENRGFKKFISKRGQRYTPNTELRRYISTIDGIYVLSCKYGFMIETFLNSTGKGYVFFNYIDVGIITFAVCLEAQGYTRFNETESIFVARDETQVRSYCSTKGSQENRYVRHNIRGVSEGAARRYAMLNAETTDKQRNTLFEAFNSYENRHGEYISIIIVSGVGRDGINLSDIEHVFIAGGDWNESKTYQAESRAIRATSHDDLLDEERERLISSGQDPSTASFIIKKHRLAAIAELDGEAHSIDLLMYSVAEAKNRQIHRVERMIKRIAIGCELNYARNVRDTDEDYSPQCDYDVCEYSCFDREYVSNERVEDFSTYDARYSHTLLSRVIDDINELFKHQDVISRKDASARLSQYRNTQVDRGLERIVSGKMSLTDRYGYTAYLVEDGDIFFLTRVYPIDDDRGQLINSYYSNKLIALTQTQITEIGDIVERSEVPSIIEYLETLDIDDTGGLIDILQTLSVEMQAMILEDVLVRQYNYNYDLTGEDTDYINAILEKYRRMIFYIPEPYEELQKLRDDQLSGKRKNTKKKNINKIKIKTYKANELDEMIRQQELNPPRNDTPIQVLHIMYSQALDRTKYATTTRFNRADGRLRLLDNIDGVNIFRDLSNFEIPTYNRLIQMETRKRVKPLEDRGIYGFYGIDGMFRIRYRLLENQDENNVNGRRVKRGKECHTWERHELIDIMWEIGAYDEDEAETTRISSSDREDAVNYLLERNVNYSRQEMKSWSDYRLLFYVDWYYNTGSTRDDMCQIIENQMEVTGLIA